MSTRKRIIEYLRKHRAVTAGELSRSLHLTPANIRIHLANLLLEGQLQIIGHHNSGKPGRPQKIYALSPVKDIENLVLLTKALLLEIRDRMPQQQYLEMIAQVAQRLAGETSSHSQLTVRLNNAVQRLNQLNYQARWEAHKDAPRLFLGHCPFLSLLDTHPEMCHLDAQLISTLLNLPVVQITKLTQDSRSVPYCLFNIQEKHPST